MAELTQRVYMHDGRVFVHEADYERVEKERDELLSAIKQHRNATEDRLRKLGHREAALGMLSPDRHLYEAAERIEGNGRHSQRSGVGMAEIQPFQLVRLRELRRRENERRYGGASTGKGREQ